MKLPTLSPAKLKVLAVLLPLGALLLWVALRTGPMAPIPVTEVQVRQQALTPQLFGLGMVQARQLHTLGPTVAGRVQTLRVDVGDSVQAGQVLGSMTHWVWSALLSWFFPVFLSVGGTYIFGFFALIALGSLIFAIKLPETKDKSLEQIQKELVK